LVKQKKLQESDYAPFFYPTVMTVLKFIEELASKESDQTAKEAAASLRGKLRVLADDPNFNSWSSFSLEAADYAYIDLHYIKNLSSFPAIYLYLFLKALKEMRRENPHRPKLFVNDEFHNISRYPTFAKLFEVLAREAPKMNIYQFLISQDPADVEHIKQSIGTRVFLKAAPLVEGVESAAKEFEDRARQVFNLNDEAVRELSTLPRFMPLFVYSGGHFTLAPPVSEVKLKLFESREITEIITPDGIRIKKTYVEEE